MCCSKNLELKPYPCNLCGSEPENFKKLYQIRGFTVVQCPKCGLIFVNPRLSDQELQHIYASDDYFFCQDSVHRGYEDYAKLGPYLKATFQRRWQETIGNETPAGKILDVGCAFGFFLEVAQEKGWQVYGTECSAPAVQHCQQQGFQNIFQGGIEEADFEENFFDLITLWDVLEHLPYPKETLRSIHKYLKPGGKLLITTPDIESWPARLFRSHWFGFNKIAEHLFYFSPKTLSHLLSESGYKPLVNEPTCFLISLKFLASKLPEYNKLLGGFIQRVIERSFLEKRYLNFRWMYMLQSATKKEFIKDC